MLRICERSSVGLWRREEHAFLIKIEAYRSEHAGSGESCLPSSASSILFQSIGFRIKHLREIYNWPQNPTFPPHETSSSSQPFTSIHGIFITYSNYQEISSCMEAAVFLFIWEGEIVEIIQCIS